LTVTIASESACSRDPNGAIGDFVVGPENRLVDVALSDLLGQAGSLCSPMVLYGPSGVGKTHLALAVVAHWKARPDHPPVKYAVAIDYARELADAIETKTLDEFGVAYRRASLLVLEDLQHLAGKQAAQRELLQILDSLADDEARVLVTASRSPGMLDDMLPGLQSRLQAGLVVPVVLPGPAARAILLRRFAGARGIELSESLIEFFAENMSGAAPALDAALVELQMGGTVNIEAARRWLADRRRQDPSLREITLATAQHFSLRLGDLRSAARRRTLVIARGVAMYLCRRLTRLSLEQIGGYFGGRDHTTVSHGCRRTEDLLQAEPAIREAVVQLQIRLRK
jgi:chromosomal replication initiator protein